ncbi:MULTISPECIES: hypothetical protein [unclassified Erwinia]|uniref:hypothetical protein n=1 Tax=unclassified Erwinia TaxID=2622719 RepID=UPI000A4A7A18|nr:MULTISPECIES: hypothetical protein [unclassified Erwinia]PLV63896.1 hypothetical protein NV64_01370 [Erwinia sp. B116]
MKKPAWLSGEGTLDSLDEALRFAGTQNQQQADVIVSLARAAFDNAYVSVLICATALLIICTLLVGYVFRQKKTISPELR